MRPTTPFCPAYGSNVKVTLAAATEQHFRIDKLNTTLRVLNTGATNELYFRTYNSGSNAATPLPSPTLASATDYRVNPSAGTFVHTDVNHDAISLFSTAGTTVEFMTGVGGI